MDDLPENFRDDRYGKVNTVAAHLFHVLTSKLGDCNEGIEINNNYSLNSYNGPHQNNNNTDHTCRGVALIGGLGGSSVLSTGRSKGRNGGGLV